jgi:hypothetical protein
MMLGAYVEPVYNTSVLVFVAYHSIVASATALVAEIVTTPAPHLDPAVPVGAAGMTLIVATTAVLADKHPAVDLAAA